MHESFYFTTVTFSLRKVTNVAKKLLKTLLIIYYIKKIFFFLSPTLLHF